MKTYKLIYAHDKGIENEITFKGSYKKAYEKIKELSIAYFSRSENMDRKEVYFWIEEYSHVIKHGYISKYNIEN